MERSQKKDPLERRAHMACSHTHMFATRLITRLSIKWYQFTGRDMPLQKSSGVAILVSLQECGFFRPRTVHRETNSEKPQVKIRFAFHFVERKYLDTFNLILARIVRAPYYAWFWHQSRWMLSFGSILNESGISSSEALHYCKMMLKSFKKSKLSPIYGIIRDKKEYSA